MIPELFNIGPLTIKSFGVMAMFAFLVPTLLMKKEFERLGKNPELAVGVTGSAMLGGLIGARIYYIVERFDDFLLHPWDYIFTGAGLVWYGGLLGGFLAVWWYARRQKLTLTFVSDVAAPLLALGQAFGRVGCFLSGDGDYGPPTDLPWAMSFPKGVVPTNELVHPTPVYDTILLTAIFFILWKVRKQSFAPGVMISLYMILVGVERLATEVFRRTAEVAFGLTMAQWISVGLILVGGIVIVRSSKRAVRGEAKA
jgi:phosphatidylglycerol:prolipoprotein diacylglycerol transferase